MDRIASEAALREYDFSFLYERLSDDEMLSGQNLNKIEEEFRRFMTLVIWSDGPLAMIDRRVDQFWHMFILFTPQYAEFCKLVMGFFVHHQPRTSMTPVPDLAITNFVSAYVSQYGELGQFWLEQLEPEMKSAVESGVIPESLSVKWSGWTGRPRP